MLAYDYPILGVFWTMLIFFVWVAWIMLLFRVIADIFRADDMGGIAKAFWCIFVIVAPFLGILVYLIANGDDMTRRRLEDAQASQAAFQSYVRDAAGTSGVSAAQQLGQLADLRATGVLSEAEFADQKSKLLAN